MTNQQPAPQQPVQQPAPQQPVQQPAPQQPVQQPSTITFNTSAPENANNNAYESIIEQQNAQIAALMAQNNALNQQVTQMVQNGAQFKQQPQQPQQQQVGQNWAVQPAQQQYAPIYTGNDNMPLSLASNIDISLESLAKEIGKSKSSE